MKQTDSRERLKALMRQHTATVTTAMPAQAPAADSRPPRTATVNPPLSQPATATPQTQNVRWDRITIRLTVGELQKINDVVIATQQATRTAKVTTTDILRVALRRVKDYEALDAGELKAVRAPDKRLPRSIPSDSPKV